MHPTPGVAFQILVKKILIKLGYQILDETKDFTLDLGLDFIVSKDNVTLGIETRFYRTKNIYGSLVATALTNLMRGMENSQIHKGILITSCNLPSINTTTAPNIQLWGRTELLKIVAEAPDLQDELVSLLEIGPDELPKPPPLDLSLHNSIGVSDNYELTIDEPPTQANHPTGQRLIEALKALAPGKKTACEYERLGKEIFQYLFDNDLDNWHPQLSTTDGLNRYDFVCRIKGLTAFWHFLLHNLNSRYLIIEFKNYSEEIAQGQVLTTEKYLLENALRRFAIITSRKGASDSALKMAQGAMRESGKLIIILDDDDLNKMLQRKDSGRDPSDHLFDLVDDFLLKLPR